MEMWLEMYFSILIYNLIYDLISGEQIRSNLPTNNTEHDNYINIVQWDKKPIVCA